MVLEEGYPCFVEALKEKKKGRKRQSEMLSTIQLKKELQKWKENYLTALVEIHEG